MKSSSNNPEQAALTNDGFVSPDDCTAIVLKDRRRSPRLPLNRVAKFHSGVGSLPRDCIVTDISDQGARLYCEAEMPEQFMLSVSTEGKHIRQECRVVWRLGGELGVEFVRRGPR